MISRGIFVDDVFDAVGRGGGGGGGGAPVAAGAAGAAAGLVMVL